MRVCITLRADSQPDIEQRVLEFTERLEHVCDSIVSCDVVVEDPRPPAEDAQAWSVRVSLELFGEELRVRGVGSTIDGAEALNLALQDALLKVVQKLQSITSEHCACTCARSLTRNQVA